MMTPEARRACVAALDAAERAAAAAERAAQALRAVLAAEATAEPDAGAGDLMRCKDVAAEAGVSIWTARRWAQQRGVRRGGVLYLPRSCMEPKAGRRRSKLEE